MKEDKIECWECGEEKERATYSIYKNRKEIKVTSCFMCVCQDCYDKIETIKIGEEKKGKW